jgi:hypothetical protein
MRLSPYDYRPTIAMQRKLRASWPDGFREFIKTLL